MFRGMLWARKVFTSLKFTFDKVKQAPNKSELCCGATTLNFKRSNSCWEKDMMDRRIWPLHQPREKIEIELLVLGDHINQSRNRGLANDKERLGQSVLCAASKVDTGTSWGDSEMCTPVCLHNTTKKKLGVS